LKDAYYFSHDSNARNDPKIQALMSKWGYEGYGWFWAVLETLREQSDYKYPVNKYTFDTFARIFCTTREKSSEFLSDCCHEFADENGGLLTIDEQYLWSDSFLKRMSVIDEKRDKARDSVNKRWSNNERNTDVIRTHNERTADVIQGKERKGKESKEKKNTIEDIFSSFTDDPKLLDALQSFAKMRRDIKKPLTERAAQLIVGKLTEQSSSIPVQIALLEQSIMNSWQGIFPLKTQYGQPVQVEPQRSRYREVD